MSETQAGKFVKFLVPLLTTRRGHRGVGQYAYCLECKFKKTLNIIFHQVDKVRNLFGVSVHCNAKIDKVLPTSTNSTPKDRMAPVCFILPPCPETRPERWIVTIPSSDQWLATIGNHWKTIATNGFGDQKPLKTHC